LARFIHSSDLHLAKPFGRFDEDLRGRLREARYEKIALLAKTARDHNTNIVLLAGDTFDAETPQPQVVRHAIRAFGAEKDITWVLLPGNHDSLAAGDLWDRMIRENPENVILALSPEPIFVGDDMVILPAPPTSRNPGRDLTEWMDDFECPEELSGRVTVGLAHGSIQDFGEDDALGIIPPDRPARANLDYLALGDWHGRIRVGPRCWYSGTPEADNFKNQGGAGVLVVDISAPGAEPVVDVVQTSTFTWSEVETDFRPGDDIEDRILQELPPVSDRRQTLMMIHCAGRLSLADRANLTSGLQKSADDFSFFDMDLQSLAIEQEAGDLDHIDTGGALRAAAESISANASDETRTEEQRQISSAALARLYDYAAEDRS
jgi:DNA repair exonuclease SbcCD nuclease subunit